MLVQKSSRKCFFQRKHSGARGRTFLVSCVNIIYCQCAVKSRASFHSKRHVETRLSSMSTPAPSCVVCRVCFYDTLNVLTVKCSRLHVPPNLSVDPRRCSHYSASSFVFVWKMFSSPPSPQQFHDGLGFLTSHSLLSNTFEHSLQQVNPKLTLPYWDFTIESSSAGAAAAEGLDNMFGSEIKTPLLQESWFGTTDPATNMVRFRWVERRGQ